MIFQKKIICKSASYKAVLYQNQRGCLTTKSSVKSRKNRKSSDNYQFGEFLVTTELGWTDFFGKSLNDEREAYKRYTERGNEDKNTIKMENFVEI